MKQTFSSEANGRSADEEYLCFYGNRRIIIVKSPPLVPVLSQLNLVSTLIYSFFWDAFWYYPPIYI
jgi:hypothetical protein